MEPQSLNLIAVMLGGRAAERCCCRCDCTALLRMGPFVGALGCTGPAICLCNGGAFVTDAIPCAVSLKPQHGLRLPTPGCCVCALTPTPTLILISTFIPTLTLESNLNSTLTGLGPHGRGAARGGGADACCAPRLRAGVRCRQAGQQRRGRGSADRRRRRRAHRPGLPAAAGAAPGGAQRRAPGTLAINPRILTPTVSLLAPSTGCNILHVTCCHDLYAGPVLLLPSVYMKHCLTLFVDLAHVFMP